MPSKLQIKDKSETGKLIKIASFRKDIRKTEPHKHNSYFEIIYLANGSGTHTIDYTAHVVQPPVLFFVRKEQIHHWELVTEPEGYVIILKKGFIEKSLDGELKNLFTKLSSLSSLQVKDTSTLEKLFQLLQTESNDNQESRFSIIEGLLKALLAKILEVAQPFMNKKIAKPNLYNAYRELLSQSSEIKNSVAHYAAMLNTTPQNLNMVCRKVVDKTAADVLSEHIISEAKRLLIYTDKTIAEIAFALEFTDSSHFVKYFKRHIGNTPQVFRSL